MLHLAENWNGRGSSCISSYKSKISPPPPALGKNGLCSELAVTNCSFTVQGNVKISKFI